MNDYLRWRMAVAAALVLASFCCRNAAAEAPAAAGAKLNVLFIAADDLRPELGCYGKTLVKSPNIDRLAAAGLRFNRAYCQQAICGPSRASLMTGLRPDATGVIHNEANFRDKNPDIITLPQHFRMQGYQTVHVGKIFHPNMIDLEKSWSMSPRSDWAHGAAPYQLAENKQWIQQKRRELEDKWGRPAKEFIPGPVTEAADVPDEAYLDGRIAAEAIELLKKLQGDAGRPFFLGVGFHKPHLPFIAPKRYWDRYDPAALPLAANPLPPAGMPALALHDSFELRSYGRVPKTEAIDQRAARHFIHGYLACVSYADAQVGKVLDALDRLGLRERTIVILWGDNGWHLGDHGVWGKATNFEAATRVPLVIRAPGMPAAGQSSDALVELVDMYPTLCELAGLPLPPHLQGCSFAPLLKDPAQAWKGAAFSQYPCPALREWAALPPSPQMRQGEFASLIEAKERQIAAEMGDRWSRERFEEHVMGYAMRTDRYRLVEWIDQREPERPLALELYDYQKDPLEKVNLAVQAEQRPLVESLLQQLRGGWRGQLPSSAARKSGGGGVIDNSQSPYAKIRAVDHDAVRWTEGFWAERFDLCRRVVVPHMYEVLSNPRNSANFCNLQIAAGQREGKFFGNLWSDGDCYKWIEAAASIYNVTRDPQLDRRMDDLIGAIAKAQAPDGYISTQIQLNATKKRWEDLHNHELYNMGHLLTAACIHRRATGKDNFLRVARKTADYLFGVFTPRPKELAHFGFNPSNIMGAVELYRTTGEARYLQLAQTFVDMRGSQPGGSDQNQSAVPLRKETVAVGHAVTANYLWAGAADVYAETGEKALLDALERIWRDATERKTYLTGGQAALHHGESSRGIAKRKPAYDAVYEAFGGPYELPNRTAYNETCANIASAMWDWRMLSLTGDAKYADAMERVLYNSMLSSTQLDGRSFFYSNPLHRCGPEVPLWNNDSAQRWGDTTPESPVHCFCCPPSVARTIAQLQGWAYGLSDDGVWVHLYGGSTLNTRLADGSLLGLSQQTDYPWDGKITLTVQNAPAREFALRLRIPAWVERPAIRLNGQPAAIECRPGSYASLQRRWQRGDRVELDLPMEATLIESHPLVEETRGQAALMRGPIVYCLESVDLPPGVRLDDVRLRSDGRWTAHHDRALLGGVTVLEGEAMVAPAAGPTGGLYRKLPSGTARHAPLRLIPYYAWCNRGQSEMSVWIPLE